MQPNLSARRPSNRARRSLTAILGLGLVAAPLTVLASPAQAADPIPVDIISTNDFHGRLLPGETADEKAGAAVLAGAVKQFKADNPDTIFAAAGDLIGASTFESFVAQDKPTIDVMNEAGLEVSSVGNHEFDQGYDDLVNRVIQPESEANPYGGAMWEYLAANVKRKDGAEDELADTWIKDFGDVQVGFVGTVTEALPSLVSPDGISEIEVGDIVEATNTGAAELRDAGADIVVMLVHEGAPSTDCSTMGADPTSRWGEIVTGVNGDVDGIVSGHTHLAYACDLPVPDEAGTTRPVVSAGQYGENLNRVRFLYDPDTGQHTVEASEILPLLDGDDNANYPVDPATQAIVDAAVEQAEELGARPLGQIAGRFDRAKDPAGDENRGGESTVSNTIAEVQRYATDTQIAFMNPGGVRADLVGENADGYPATVTYKQAALTQPFANTLVTMQLTGDQIEQLLEQQWQPDGSSRPFLRLGTSDGFTATYDPTADRGEHVAGMWLDGEPIAAGETYTATANSFLASGGDNFTTFADGAAQTDSGKIDLQSMVDYLAEFGTEGDPLAPDYAQHMVGVDFPNSAPASYAPGDTVSFDLSSLAMTGDARVTDDQVTVSLGEEDLGTFDVDNTVLEGVQDESGTATVSVDLPAGTTTGEQTLVVTGATTGTTTEVPVTVGSGGGNGGGNGGGSSPTITLYKTKSPLQAGTQRPYVVAKVAGARPGEWLTAVTGTGKYFQQIRANGTAVFPLQPYAKPGSKKVGVVLKGNGRHGFASKATYFYVTR